MMIRTNNPIADFERHDRLQAEYERKLPKCDLCGETIHDDFYSIDDERICEDCLKEFYLVSIDNYVA